MQHRPSEQVDIRNMDLKHAADLGPLGGTEVLACTGLGSDCVQIDTAMLVVRIKLQGDVTRLTNKRNKGGTCSKRVPLLPCNATA